MKLGVIIPAYNEEASIGSVVRRCFQETGQYEATRIVVCDNGSTDNTAGVAKGEGAEVVRVIEKGYGAACRGGVQFLREWPTILVFLDGDGSSRPEEIPVVVKSVAEGSSDLVVGSRPRKASMTLPQRWGTWLAVTMVNLRWGCDFVDMGPFRAIRRECLESLEMRDRTWGWTIEMQILAHLKGLRVKEIPVSWQERLAGASKISGTFSGVVRAGARIVWTVFRYSARSR
jgi:glycosyltransferase involved in cell wall biosynthesis